MPEKSNLLSFTPAEFIGFLKNEDIHKFYFAYDSEKKKLTASHPKLQPIADYFTEDKRDFIEHEGLFFKVSDNYDMLLGAFVHRTNRGQAAGGVRYWEYDTIESYFRDGLRLGAGMTFKNALAGLWWGGGKGVIAHNPAYNKMATEVREKIYREYGIFISTLNGCYVTAEDVGTGVEDMANVFSGTRFTTCIPPRFGGSGNPSVPTARGIISGMEAALEFSGSGTLEGKTVAVQGTGHVGEPLIGFLFEKNVNKVIAADINRDNVNSAKKKFNSRNFECRVVDKKDLSIFNEECDIFSPNATGAVLNPQTIPMIKAGIICGAANNQLEDMHRDGRAIHDKGIIYVPDFLTNRMGIVYCAHEPYGYINNDPLIDNHFSRDWEHSIFNRTVEILKESRDEDIPGAEIALKLADRLSKENHPVHGHRGKLIIKSLVENQWHLG